MQDSFSWYKRLASSPWLGFSDMGVPRGVWTRLTVSAAYSPRILFLGLSWPQVAQTVRDVLPAGSPPGCVHLPTPPTLGGMWSSLQVSPWLIRLVCGNSNWCPLLHAFPRFTSCLLTFWPRTMSPITCPHLPPTQDTIRLGGEKWKGTQYTNPLYQLLRVTTEDS